MVPTFCPDMPPSTWLCRFSSLIPQGSVLDLACGSGRNARYLAGLGYAVSALDVNTSSFPDMEAFGIHTIELDLERPEPEFRWPFAEQSFSAIIVCNYLYRPLFPKLLRSLKNEGLLIYETFAHGNAQFGKPSRPDFLLEPGELIEQMHSVPEICMQIIAFEDGYVDHPKPAMMQRICARRVST